LGAGAATCGRGVRTRRTATCAATPGGRWGGPTRAVSARFSAPSTPPHTTTMLGLGTPPPPPPSRGPAGAVGGLHTAHRADPPAPPPHASPGAGADHSGCLESAVWNCGYQPATSGCPSHFLPPTRHPPPPPPPPPPPGPLVHTVTAVVGSTAIHTLSRFRKGAVGPAPRSTSWPVLRTGSAAWWSFCQAHSFHPAAPLDLSLSPSLTHPPPPTPRHARG